MIFFNFINYLTTALMIAILIRAVLSWFPGVSRENPLVQIVFQVTEPVLAPLRRVVPTFGFVDLTPLVAIILLQLIQGAAAGAVRGF